MAWNRRHRHQVVRIRRLLLDRTLRVDRVFTVSIVGVCTWPAAGCTGSRYDHGVSNITSNPRGVRSRVEYESTTDVRVLGGLFASIWRIWHSWASVCSLSPIVMPFGYGIFSACWFTDSAAVWVPGDPSAVGMAWQWSTKLAIAIWMGVRIVGVSCGLRDYARVRDWFVLGAWVLGAIFTWH